MRVEMSEDDLSAGDSIEVFAKPSSCERAVIDYTERLDFRPFREQLIVTQAQNIREHAEDDQPTPRDADEGIAIEFLSTDLIDQSTC